MTRRGPREEYELRLHYFSYPRHAVVRPYAVQAKQIMKRLLVFRHGKSDWDADYGVDFERPLALRGQKAARTMGRFLAPQRAAFAAQRPES